MKKAVRQCVEHLEQVLTPEEFAGAELTHGGKHFRLRLPALQHTVTIPGTPSDRMWFLAWRTSVKRALEAKRQQLGVTA